MWHKKTHLLSYSKFETMLIKVFGLIRLFSLNSYKFNLNCNLCDLCGKYYTDNSLLWGKYTRMFVPRFPGIPEMLYFPTPSASGNITSRGFPGTSGQTFWYISKKQWNNCYVTFYSWKHLKNRSEILGAM